MLRIEYWSCRPNDMIDDLSNATLCYALLIKLTTNMPILHFYIFNIVKFNNFLIVLNILFLHNLNFRVGWKNKNINQQEQFYFYSSFGKIRVGESHKSEK